MLTSVYTWDFTTLAQITIGIKSKRESKIFGHSSWEKFGAV